MDVSVFGKGIGSELRSAAKLEAAVQWKAPKANPAAEDRRSPLRFPVCWERLLHRHSHQERPTAEEDRSALGAGSVLYRKVPESPECHWQE